MKFLIVDDNQSMRQTIVKLVAHEQDEIVECEDGKDAVRLYRECRPDWVLMDIGMKEVNGIAATENIIAADAGAKIVIVTDYNDRYFREAAKNAGACHFVTKEHLSEIETIVRGGE